jgi:photosystem II stability/assembly factor-like uncharacterized protein
VTNGCFVERLLRWFLVFGLVLAQTFAAPVEARDAVPVETLWHIHAIEVAPGTPTRLYLATHQGVLLAGMDGFAERISAITDDFRSFARHPRLPNVFYASVSTGTGAYPAVMISDDGARTWSWLSKVMVDDRSVAFDTLTISAVDPDVLYGAATSLYISRDGGRSWSAKVAPFEPIFDLVASSVDPETIYAASAKGVWRSADAGGSWRTVYSATNATTMVHVTPEGTLFAFVAGEGLIRATEPSLDWTPVRGDLGRYALLHLAVDPADANRLFAVTDNSQVIASEDSGMTWTSVQSRGVPRIHDVP